MPERVHPNPRHVGVVVKDSGQVGRDNTARFGLGSTSRNSLTACGLRSGIAAAAMTPASLVFRYTSMMPAPSALV